MKVLILNGSFCELPIIKMAKQMGHYVITTGNMPNLIGHKHSDEYINVDYSDKETILKIVKENNVERILSCANDFGVITASYVAEEMGWPGHDSYQTAKLLHHKDKFKEYVKTHGIPSPLSTIFSTREQAEIFAEDTEYPIIVKANDLTGGKGIMKAENYQEATVAINNAFERSRDKHIVIEPFIDGTQHTIVSFVSDKKVISSVSCNCYSPINPYLIQTETLPADEIEKLQPQLYEIIEKISTDLNLVDGIFALQYLKKDGKPYIIEMMRRCFGNQFLTLADMVSGFPWEEAFIRGEMGEDCHNLTVKEPEVKYCGHHGIMANRNGIIKSYSIASHIEEHIFNKIEMVKPGDYINDYMNERIAYIYYKYANKVDMDNAVREFNNNIKVEFKDD